ncbi:MAG: hypothetical protein AB7S26_17410 [Sandaracinaceae bacterium]
MGRSFALLAALLGGLSLAPRAFAQCEVRGVASVERLRVRVDGQRMRTLSVIDLPVAVRPGRGEATRDVRVLAPLAFGARSDARIAWAVPRPMELASGMLWMTPEAEIEQLREARDGRVELRIRVDEGVFLDRLRLPCDALTVGHGEGHEHAGWRHSPGPRWRMVRDHIWLAAEREGSPERVRLDARDGLPEPFVELERIDSWVRVLARFSSGAAVRGWVRQHHLRAVDERGQPAHYEHTASANPVPQCRRRDPRRGEYVGPAHITVGAHIHMSRGGPVWATVAEPAVFTVSVRGNEPWVRVVHVPGLRGDGQCPEVLHDAWVERSMVSLSGEGGRYDPMELIGVE